MDLGANQLTAFPLLPPSKLEDVWMNNNLIEELSLIDCLKELPELRTIYLEHNPVARYSLHYVITSANILICILVNLNIGNMSKM